MGKSVNYQQCTMRRPLDEGSVVTTSYIPQRFAKVGEVLKLKDKDAWVDGWIVEKVGESIIESAELPDYRKAIRHHRKLTGDSNPRRER